MSVQLVIGLPSAMVYLGWPAGVIIMTLSWVATLYTLYQMCAMHEVNGRWVLSTYSMHSPWKCVLQQLPKSLMSHDSCVVHCRPVGVVFSKVQQVLEFAQVNIESTIKSTTCKA